MKKKGKQKGFTLVELMIVVAIIAIIASVAIPSVYSARRSSNATSALANLKSFATSMGNYCQDLDAQTYPLNSTKFGEYYSHIDVKNGYRYFYRTNSNFGEDPSKMVYLAVPTNETSGSTCYYVDESYRIWENTVHWDTRSESEIDETEPLTIDFNKSTTTEDGIQYGNRMEFEGIESFWKAADG